MKLKILVLQESKSAKVPRDISPFRWRTHYISEIYIHLLPKININNSSKVLLEFGPQGDSDVAFDSMFGCTNVFIDDFDFNKFSSSSIQEQNFILINKIQESLISIYKRKNNNLEDIKLILSTTDEVSMIGFKLDIIINKLQKITKDRTKKIEIHRILNNDVNEAWKCIIRNRMDSSILKEIWMTEIPGNLDRTDCFKKAEIKENFYIIYDNLGSIAFQIEIDDMFD